MRSFCCCAVLLVCLTGGSVSHAQTAPTAEEQAQRRLLIDEAGRARAASQHDRALDLAQRAATIQMTPSLRLFIAQEQERLGRLADAFGNADVCSREARALTPPMPALVATCQALVDMLRERVPHVTITTPTPAPEQLQVWVNDAVLSPVFWGVPSVVTPGVVRVRASAPGFRLWTRELLVGERARVAVTISLEPEEPQIIRSFADAPNGTARQPLVVSTPRRTSTTEQEEGPNWGPWIVGGTGAAVLLSSLVFQALRGGVIEQCRVGSASEDVFCRTQELVDAGNLHQSLMYTSIGVGGAALVAGALWFAVLRADSGPRRGVVVRAFPVTGVGSFGVGVQM